MPPFVTCQITRHGKRVYYFRRGKGARTRLPHLGAPDFDVAYLAALSGAGIQRTAVIGANSLQWLVTRYRTSTDYIGLSSATRRQRDNIFKHVVEAAGDYPYRDVSRSMIAQGREDRATTPSQARNFLDAMRGLFRWALEAELVTVDPTVGVKNPRRPKGGEGFPAWSMEDVAAFERRWPTGSHERVWLYVLLYTGLRRGDAVLVGRQHVRNGVATLKTEKNHTEVSIPILPALAATLDGGPVGDLAFIVGKNGSPLTKETFGNYFKRACVAAGLSKRSAHGLRKIGATIAAEAGATVAELEALFGWNGGAMASHYTKTANRKQLAAQASEKIRNAQTPHLVSAAPHLKKIP